MSRVDTVVDSVADIQVVECPVVDSVADIQVVECPVVASVADIQAVASQVADIQVVASQVADIQVASVAIASQDTAAGDTVPSGGVELGDQLGTINMLGGQDTVTTMARALLKTTTVTSSQALERTAQFITVT
jgi:hypothetical protein